MNAGAGPEGAELFGLILSELQKEEDTGAPVKSVRVRCSRDAQALIPIYCALGIEAEFTGVQGLPDDVFELVSGCLSKHGVRVERRDGAVCCSGRLIPGYFNIPAEVSSAFVCGLLCALPLLRGFSVLSVFGKAQDGELVGSCEEFLRGSGIQFDKKGGTYIIPPDQKFIFPASSCLPDRPHFPI